MPHRHTAGMKRWAETLVERLLVLAYRLRAHSRLPSTVRMGRLGTWSTLTVALATAVVLLTLSLASYTGVQLARFDRTDVRRTTFVFAAPQPLTAGLNVSRVDLAAMLGRLRYTE